MLIVSLPPQVAFGVLSSRASQDTREPHNGTVYEFPSVPRGIRGVDTNDTTNRFIDLRAGLDGTRAEQSSTGNEPN